MLFLVSHFKLKDVMAIVPALATSAVKDTKNRFGKANMYISRKF